MKHNGKAFQRKSKQRHGKQPATKEAQDNVERRTVLTKLHPLPLSNEALAAMRIRVLRLERKAKSPRILITHQGDKFPLLLDEGSSPF